MQVTLTDRKLGVVQNESSSFTHYLADVRSAVDYYPFGMQMPGRSGVGGYRWGFSSQEKDDDIYGYGNSYNFEFRIQNSKLGRFLSIDPLANEYPWNSTYAYSENRVIDGTDLEGLEYTNKTGGAVGPLNDKSAFENGATLTDGFENEASTDERKKSESLKKILNYHSSTGNQLPTPFTPKKETVKEYSPLEERQDLAMSRQIGQGFVDGFTGQGSISIAKGFNNIFKTLKTFKGIPSIKYTKGMTVIKYVPEGRVPELFNNEAISYTTNMITNSTNEVYNGLSLGFITSSGSINQMANSYTAYSTVLRGFYFSGKIGVQGTTTGGASQFVTFRGFGSFKKFKPLFTTNSF